MSAVRNTTRRDNHRAAVSEGHPPCHWCGNDIDYDAHHLNPLAFQVDHVTPLSKARPGEDLDTLDNCVPSHRACNRAKSDKVLYQQGVTFITERMWWP